jgi:hypothetical protein
VSGGRVIEQGVILGKPYRVWCCWDTGKKIVYWGSNKQRSGQVGRRRSMGWLKKHKKMEAALSESAK